MKPWRWTKTRIAYRNILTDPESSYTPNKLKAYVEMQLRKIAKEDNWSKAKLDKEIKDEYTEIDRVVHRIPSKDLEKGKSNE